MAALGYATEPGPAALQLVVEDPHECDTSTWERPAIEADVHDLGVIRGARLLDAARLTAGEVVQRVHALDPCLGVVKLHAQSLGGPRQIEVEQVAVALCQDAVGVGHRDFVVKGFRAKSY